MMFSFFLAFSGIFLTGFASDHFHLESSFEIAESLMTPSGIPLVDSDHIPKSEFHSLSDHYELHLQTRTVQDKLSFVENGQEAQAMLHEKDRIPSLPFPSNVPQVLGYIRCAATNALGGSCRLLLLTDKCPTGLTCSSTKGGLNAPTDIIITGLTDQPIPHSLIVPSKVARTNFVSATNFP